MGKKEDNPPIDQTQALLILCIKLIYLTLHFCKNNEFETKSFFFQGYKMRNQEDNPPIDQTQALLNHSMHQSSSGMTQEQPDNVPSVQLVIVIGKGKYGNVWKAKQTLNSKEIAVKTFSLASKKSWEDEKNIYKLPHMDSHPNVLKFLFATQKYDNLNTEFWLATELQVSS